MGSLISSIGLHIPEQILTNQDLERIVDTSDEWITQRTGIKERRIAEEHETNQTMAVQAALTALDQVTDDLPVDYIILATNTNEHSQVQYPTPSFHTKLINAC